MASVALGYSQITGIDAAAKGLGDGTDPASGLAVSIPAGSGTYVVVEAEAGAVRWRDDGTAPTATQGQILGAGSVLTFSGRLSRLKFIAVLGGVGTKVNVSFEKSGGAP
jgi:hypothetical protein